MNNLLTQAAATPPDHSIREIPLTQGKVALVDAADYEWLSQWKWCASRCRNKWYALRAFIKNGKKTTITMHSMLLDAPTSQQRDHIDGDGLNNLRSNLRLATHSQNGCNRGRPRNNISGHKGVSFYARTNKWIAQIIVNNKSTFLGYFADYNDAAHAYDEAARLLHGEFARTV